jgi:hypothetical protein
MPAASVVLLKDMLLFVEPTPNSSLGDINSLRDRVSSLLNAYYTTRALYKALSFLGLG